MILNFEAVAKNFSSVVGLLVSLLLCEYDSVGNRNASCVRSARSSRSRQYNIRLTSSRTTDLVF